MWVTNIVIRADLINRRRRHCPDTSAYRMSQGQCSEGEARSDANAVQSPNQRTRNRSTLNRTDTIIPVFVSPPVWI